MDTNRNDGQNYQINTFNKGMNTDTALDAVGEGQYIFGLNIRIANNTLLIGDIDPNSKEGLVTPVQDGKSFKNGIIRTNVEGYDRILAAASINNIGVVIVKRNGKWTVFRVDKNSDGKTNSYVLYRSSSTTDKDKFSVVINKEQEDIIKLYIADGEHGIMQLFVKNGDESNVERLPDHIIGLNPLLDEDALVSGKYFPDLKTKILGTVSGRLKTQQVQYTYRFYKRFGIFSKVAPLTNKILIINSNRNVEEGNAENTRTNIGMRLEIPINNDIKMLFDHIQLIRVSYIIAGQVPEIDIVKDIKFDVDKDDNKFEVTDAGEDSLQELSLDEFAALNTQAIVPLVIEQNQGFMFAANIVDDTIYDPGISQDYFKTESRTWENGNAVIAEPDINKPTLQYKNKEDTIAGSRRGPNINGDNINQFFEQVRPLLYQTEMDDEVGGAETHIDGNVPTETWQNGVTNTLSHIGNMLKTTIEAMTNGDEGLDIQQDEEQDTQTYYVNYIGGAKKDENDINIIEWNLIYGDVAISDMTDKTQSITKNVIENEGEQTPTVGSIYELRLPINPNNKGADDLFSCNVDQYKENLGLADTISLTSYTDMFTSSIFKSLMRGETYRYGIVLYNKHGQKSNAYYITDVCVPSEAELASTIYLKQTDENGYDKKGYLFARPIGVKFTVNEKKLPDDVVGYEIVRCQKTLDYTRILLQCALSRPMQQGRYNDESYRTPYYPGFLLTTLFLYVENLSNLRDWRETGDFLLGALPWVGNPRSAVGIGIHPLALAFTDPANPKYSYQSGEAGFYNTWGSLDAGTKGPVTGYFDRSATNIDNRSLYQMFASEILERRIDTLQRLAQTNLKFEPISYKTPVVTTKGLGMSVDLTDLTPINGHSVITERPLMYQARSSSTGNNPVLLLFPFYNKFTKDNKQESSNTMLLYYSTTKPISGLLARVEWQSLDEHVELNPLSITSIKDVKNPLWNSGFTDINTNSTNSEIVTGVKAYKGYSTSIAGFEYVNWIANGMYNLAISRDEALNQEGNGSEKLRVYTDTLLTFIDENGKVEKTSMARGWIGAGPVCFLAATQKPTNPGEDVFSVFNIQLYDKNRIVMSETGEVDDWYYDKWLNSNADQIQRIHNYPGSICTNVTHEALLFSGNDYQFDTYVGFGNYHKRGEDAFVFDGDVYITPCEFVSMFKAYDFKSIYDTIESNQVVYYVPMESKINTFFDYGMNYRNTQSNNLLLEPGAITGITVQDRPLHQYNAIYSDNDTSILMYSAQPLETRTNRFQQRICYSQHKDNGEQIESWNTFKPVDYIDADTRYGEITNLLSANDTLFFWQDRAFGKLSVNERSLVTDNNNNTIQLGQGGVLQRTDYLSTKYGMRPQDYSAINTETGLFWIDILNKAIVANSKEGVVNYGEMLNVLNLINKGTIEDRPEIDYDLLNSELLCKCLKDGAQLVFNVKYNIATSVYTRQYDKMLYYNNVMYAIKNSDARKLNYIKSEEETEILPNSVLQFVVNNSPSLTKVFDNQKIVIASNQRDREYGLTVEFNTELGNTSRITLLKNDDDILVRFDRDNKPMTDREGNICYAIPRQEMYENILNHANYAATPQLRMRGKWMTVKISDVEPKLDFAISHIITKFRQSYS